MLLKTSARLIKRLRMRTRRLERLILQCLQAGASSLTMAAWIACVPWEHLSKAKKMVRSKIKVGAYLEKGLTEQAGTSVPKKSNRQTLTIII